MSIFRKFFLLFQLQKAFKVSFFEKFTKIVIQKDSHSIAKSSKIQEKGVWDGDLARQKQDPKMYPKKYQTMTSPEGGS